MRVATVAVPAQPLGQRAAFAEWYEWALRTLAASPGTALRCAEAALCALNKDGDVEAAVSAARKTAGGPARDADIPAALRTYAQWYVWARLERGLPADESHQLAERAVEVSPGRVALTTGPRRPPPGTGPLLAGGLFIAGVAVAFWAAEASTPNAALLAGVAVFACIAGGCLLIGSHGADPE